MSNVLIFQPYLSNRMLSSNSLERQFRFLKNKQDTRVYALLTEQEEDYAKQLRQTNWITPILVHSALLEADTLSAVKALQEHYNFETVYVTRTYFTPCTKEHILALASLSFDKTDFRYIRDYIPIAFSDEGVKVEQMIYDPLELNYHSLISEELYTAYSSMSNVPSAKCHSFADIGYYDVNKEVKLIDKDYLFTFGGTSMSEERSDLLDNINKTLSGIPDVNLFFRYRDIDTLIPNDDYEAVAARSLFTYTIPSQNPEYMSFTRMLLALSQGTIPLIHPDNNLDCLFGGDFQFRDDLQDLLIKFMMPIDDVKLLLKNPNITLIYTHLLTEWKQTNYYRLLQELAK